MSEQNDNMKKHKSIDIRDIEPRKDAKGGKKTATKKFHPVGGGPGETDPCAGGEFTRK